VEACGAIPGRRGGWRARLRGLVQSRCAV